MSTAFQPTPPTGPGPLRHFEIYLQGFIGGVKPVVPISFPELEAKAREKLTPEAYAYIACGAGAEDTVAENNAGFDRWRIVPRMLRDVAQRDLSIELFGRKLNTPLLLAPIGVQELRAQGRGCRDRKGGRRRARADDLLQPGVGADGGNRCRDGRSPALVSALLVEVGRSHCKPCETRGGLRLRCNRGHAGHDPARLANARSRLRLPTVLPRAWGLRNTRPIRSSAGC